MGINKVQYGNTVLIDLTDTTAVASDVLAGKYFYGKDGVKTLGTGSGGGGGYVWQDQDGYIVLPPTGGGSSITVEALSVTQNGTYTAPTGKAYSPVTVNVSGSPSATQHTIYFEFTDSTDTTINAWYDDSFISNAITATTPTTYGQKTVTLAQLDGVTWYEPAPIPLNTQLIDYTAVFNGYYIDGNDGTQGVQQWACCSDFTKIDPSMTFTYVAYQWFDMAFYDASRAFISGITQSVYADTIENDYAHGTLSGARIPSNAEYVRLSSYPTITSDPSSQGIMSLIRTA